MVIIGIGEFKTCKSLKLLTIIAGWYDNKQDFINHCKKFDVKPYLILTEKEYHKYDIDDFIKVKNRLKNLLQQGNRLVEVFEYLILNKDSIENRIELELEKGKDETNVF